MPDFRPLLSQVPIPEYCFAVSRVQCDHAVHSRLIAESISHGKPSVNFISSPSELFNVSNAHLGIFWSVIIFCYTLVRFRTTWLQCVMHFLTFVVA